jgi:hypothetical protein
MILKTAPKKAKLDTPPSLTAGKALLKQKLVDILKKRKNNG